MGQNEFVSDAPKVEVTKIDPRIEREQVERVRAFRAAHEGPALAAALGAVDAAARGADNLMPPILAAVKAGATVVPIAHESTIKTGLTHGHDGVISMGRHAPGTAQADWSIMLGDMSYLDADPKNPTANPGFAAFGQVVEGLEVIRKIIVP